MSHNPSAVSPVSDGRAKSSSTTTEERAREMSQPVSDDESKKSKTAQKPEEPGKRDKSDNPGETKKGEGEQDNHRRGRDEDDRRSRDDRSSDRGRGDGDDRRGSGRGSSPSSRRRSPSPSHRGGYRRRDYDRRGGHGDRRDRYRSRSRSRGRSRDRSRSRERTRYLGNYKGDTTGGGYYNLGVSSSASSRRRSRSRSRDRKASGSSSSSTSALSVPYNPKVPQHARGHSPATVAARAAAKKQAEGAKFWDGFQWVDRTPETTQAAAAAGGGDGRTLVGARGPGGKGLSPVTQQMREERRLYVGNLIPGQVTTDALSAFLNTCMDSCLSGAGISLPAGATTAVQSVWMGPTANYAFVEFASSECALIAMGLSGIEFMGQALRISRPNMYSSGSSGGNAAGGGGNVYGSTSAALPHHTFGASTAALLANALEVPGMDAAIAKVASVLHPMT